MNIHSYRNKICQYCNFLANKASDLDAHVFEKHPEHFDKELIGGSSDSGKIKENLETDQSDFQFVKGSYFEDYL